MSSEKDASIKAHHFRKIKDIQFGSNVLNYNGARVHIYCSVDKVLDALTVRVEEEGQRYRRHADVILVISLPKQYV